MHEMSLALGMVELIESAAKEQNFKGVKTVWLELGNLAAVEKSSLEFCFSAATQGTIAEGAALSIVVVEARAECQECSHTFVIENLATPCPFCGSYQRQIAAGEEMKIKELEVV